MSGLFHFMQYDKHAPGAAIDDETRQELGRVANLFLVSAITMIALFAELFAQALEAAFIPQAVHTVLGLVFLVGWAATVVYGVYVTFTARRWLWLALCVIPPTSPPAALVYAWIRRREIEREVLGDEPSPPARRSRGGSTKR
ncbi:MAG TPA: hypothetical protein VFZ86_14160 [Thermoleophilia bacterium]|nr:hypothetical protein [Thermoleophilia bacterium]